MRIFARFFSTAVPIFIHQQAVVNEMSITSLLFKLVTPFIDQRMVDKIEFYGSEYNAVTDVLGGAEFTPNFVPGGEAQPHAWPESATILSYLKKGLPIMQTPMMEF